MLDFFSSIIEFISLLFEFILNLVESLITAIAWIATSVASATLSLGYMPGFIASCGLVVLSLSVVKFLVGR